MITGEISIAVHTLNQNSKLCNFKNLSGSSETLINWDIKCFVFANEEKKNKKNNAGTSFHYTT